MFSFVFLVSYFFLQKIFQILYFASLSNAGTLTLKPGFGTAPKLLVTYLAFGYKTV